MSTELFNVADIFGENVFNDTVMQERLPKKVYKNLRKTIEEGLLIIQAQGNVIRFVPPLIVEEKHIDEMIEKLKRALA